MANINFTPNPIAKKSGLATIVGRSNVGKSTLLNALVGTKLAITSIKPQTTRHLIQGVINDDRGQIVLIDTPGYFTEKRSPLTAKLTEKIHHAIKDIDLILYMVDPTRSIGQEERHLLSILRKVKKPQILVINKIDLNEKSLPFLEDFRALKEDFTDMIEISALKFKHLKPLKDLIFQYLPDGEPLYPTDQISNTEPRFLISEIIREKLFNTMGDEVPYTATVEIEEIEDEPKILLIKAVILTFDKRYKKMIIGQGASKIKEMGASARKELEIMMNRKVYLDLRVEVDKDWERRFE